MDPTNTPAMPPAMPPVPPSTSVRSAVDDGGVLTATVDQATAALDGLLAGDRHLRAYSELRAVDRDRAERILNESAAAVWEEQLRDAPDDAAALHHLAVIYHGLAIEAERAGESDPERLRRHWGRALRCWSALHRHDGFWEGVKERWRAEAAKGKGRADFFRPEKWDEFRQRLPKIVLAGLLDQARAAARSRPDRARMYVELAKGCDFPADARDVVRAILYGPYQPDESAAEADGDGAFDEAMDRVDEFLRLDDDYGPARGDALELCAARLDRVIARATPHAEHESLLALARGGAGTAGGSDAAFALGKFYLIVEDYCWKRAMAVMEGPRAGRRMDRDQLLRDFLSWMDRGWEACRRAIPFDHTRRARKDLFAYLSQAVPLRLIDCRGPSGAAFDKACDMVREARAVDEDEPRGLLAAARLDLLRGNRPAAADLLAKAREQMNGRGDVDVREPLEELESKVRGG